LYVCDYVCEYLCVPVYTYMYMCVHIQLAASFCNLSSPSCLVLGSMVELIGMPQQPRKRGTGHEISVESEVYVKSCRTSHVTTLAHVLLHIETDHHAYCHVYTTQHRHTPANNSNVALLTNFHTYTHTSLHILPRTRTTTGASQRTTVTN